MPRVQSSARRATHQAASAAISLNLTPMIDVTFQLLIYFLLGTSFVLGEEIYRVDLPDRSEARSRAIPLANESIVVRVRSIGSGPDDYALDIEGPVPPAGNAAELFAMLNASVVSTMNPEGTITRANPVVIAPTVDTRWEHAMDVFDAAVKAGFGRVAFATNVKSAATP